MLSMLLLICLSKWVMRASWIDRDNIIIISARSSKRQQYSKYIEFFESCIYVIRMKWNNERIKQHCDVEICRYKVTANEKWHKWSKKQSGDRKEISTKLKYFIRSMWKLKWIVTFFFAIRISGQWQIIMGDMCYVYTRKFFAQFFAKFVYGSFGLIHTYYPWLSFISVHCSFVPHLVISMRNISQRFKIKMNEYLWIFYNIMKCLF